MFEMIKNHGRWLAAAALTCALGGCGKAAPTEEAKPAACATPSAAPLANHAPSAAEKPTSGGRYEGTFEVKRHAPGLSTKQGAPAAWEKDDGKLLAGTGQLRLEIAADGTVTGTANGALGELSLRGRLEQETLRATLHNSASDPTLIQNGVLMATLSGKSLTGTLRAATGDGLLQREATVTLSKSPSGA
jgi:hypothetical protein